MSIEIKDILLKAAEDVQSGMWCKGTYFQDAAFDDYNVVRGGADMSTALGSKRCAHGSLAVASRLLGADYDQYASAYMAVVERLTATGQADSLVDFNDECLPDDPFEAGQQLAELFRSTAESL